MFRGRCASVRLACLVLLAVLALIALGPAGAAAQLSLPLGTLPDPTLLPTATTSQLPLTTVYNALNVPSIAAGGYYLDPTTGVRIYKLTSASFPTPSPNWGHDYSEGGDEVSLPYNGETRAVLLRQNGTSGGPWWLVDFTPGGGVSNPRQLTGILSPWIDLAFAFSNNPATPYYAYVSNGASIIRFDIRTMTQADGDGWPITDSNATWLHQSENDGFFTWMRGVNGPTVVGYEPSTRTLKTYTNSGVNEPRIDRAGRYIGLSMTTPPNGLVVWDWQTNTVPWSTSGDPGIPFAHNASLRDRWVVVDWNLSFPDQFATFTPPVPNSGTQVGGPAPATTVHGNGNWIQHPASGDLNDQWALFLHYGSLQPTGSSWLAPGGMIFMTPNGQRRLLGHPYNATTVYNYFSFAKVSPDGQYVMFTSDMDGSGRSDVFLAEVPVQSGSTDTTPPTVSITSPGAGATVSGTITVSANGTDNVGVAGVQFKLDGANLGAETTIPPYSISWNTATTGNGSHALTAVARDTAGNSTVSAAITVTVNNNVVTDITPPAISSISASTVSSSGATITWTTDEASDSQVEYGLTTAYGSAMPLNTSMVTSHSQSLSGLAASTLYHYRVRSRDAAGNLATSGDFTFTTLASSPNPGLAAYWAFEEGTGTTAADSSGNGNTGTLVNGPAWTAGRIGQGLAFDGLTNYVTVPSTAALNAYPLTVAVWMKTDSTTGVRGVVNKYLAGSYNGYQVFLNNGNLCAWYLRDAANYVYDGSGCPFNLAGYTDNQWHHVVYVVDASGGRLYVDGVQKGSLAWTGTAGPPSTTQPIHLAHYPGAFGGAEYFPGSTLAR
ncbi:MAG: hypothetical protein HYT85_18110 [candidate division NC10 bacterium]|nr:hypothetical protein [candidate division NC10 bacterium]